MLHQPSSKLNLLKREMDNNFVSDKTYIIIVDIILY